MKKQIFWFAIILIGCQIKSSAQVSGDLDSTFGVNGVVQLEFDTLQSHSNCVRVLPDQKILSGGYTHHVNNMTNSELVLTRLHPDGAIDSSFGVNGKAYSQVNYMDSELNAFDLSSDQKIVAVGKVNSGNSSFPACFRYFYDGLIDSSFGNNGIVLADKGSPLGFRSFNDIKTLPNGKFIAVGFCMDSTNNTLRNAMLIVKYNENGSIDSTFGQNGTLEGFLTFDAVELNAIELMANGSIFVAGYEETNYRKSFLVVKYNSSGIPDSSFGNAGIVSTPIMSTNYCEAFCMTILPNGSVVTAGRIKADVGIIKYNADGTLDLTFGAQGILDMWHGSYVANDIRVDGTDLLIAGEASLPSTDPLSICLFKVGMSGILDSSFNDDGVGNASFQPFGAETKSMDIQGSNKVILSGMTNNKYFSVARFHKTVAPLTIKEIENKNAIEVYPNPAGNIIYYKSDNSLKPYAVTDIIGKNLPFASGNNFVITENYKSGFYLLHFKDENGKLTTAKFEIKKL